MTRPSRRRSFILCTLGGVLFAWTALAAPAAFGRPGSTLKIDCQSIPSTTLGHPVETCVALPPNYDASTRRYPTLYYLHGLFENERSWIERGGEEILQGLLSTGDVGPFIVVLPDGGKSFWVNSSDGHERYEDFFIQELVPWVDSHYRTMAERAARGITGSSMGGYGALHLGMRHPDIFGSASAQSAALFDKFPATVEPGSRWAFYARILAEPFGSPLNEAYWESNNPLTLAQDPSRFAGLKLYFDCGDHDRFGFEEGAAELDRILTRKNYPHEYALRSGGHGWSYLTQYMKYPLEFHWKNFQTAEGSTGEGTARKGTP